MMDRSRGVVVDSSVLVADAQPDEPEHDAAKALLLALVRFGVDQHMPAIALVEVAAAISRGVGDAWLAQRLAETYRRRQGVHVVPVDLALAATATRLAAEQRLRGCDAVFVALAQVRGAVLVTLDREQRERAPDSVTAWHPREAMERMDS